MKKIRVITSVLQVLVIAPIWFYLVYRLLVVAKATELMWFLYWVYVPLGILCSVLSKIAEKDA